MSGTLEGEYSEYTGVSLRLMADQWALCSNFGRTAVLIHHFPVMNNNTKQTVDN